MQIVSYSKRQIPLSAKSKHGVCGLDLKHIMRYSGPYANYWRNQNEKNDAYKRDIDQCIDNIHDEEICLVNYSNTNENFCIFDNFLL